MATKRNAKGQLDSGNSEKAATPSKRYRVREGTQVAHEDRVCAEGEQLDAPEDIAREWLVLGYVEEVESRAKRKSKGS